MHSRLFHFLLLASVSSTTFAFPSSSPRQAGPKDGRHGPSSAIYFQTNEADNSLVAIPINRNDGTLSGGIKIPTHGRGANTVMNGTTIPTIPDALGSQGPVIVAGKNIFVVNAGSNTLSMFGVRAFDSTAPYLIGEPALIPGDFPNTVAVSLRHRIACVGSSGARSGVSCVPFTPRGLGAAGPLHALPLAQTTPPSSRLDILGQVFFSADEQHLFVTVRGNTGFFASIPSSALLSQSSAATFSLQGPQTTLFDGVAVPRSNKVFVADPTVGARILSVDPNTQLASVVTTVNITGQRATCWIALDERAGSAYVDDAGRRRLVELDVGTGAITDELEYGGNANGGFDLAVGGGYVYVLYAGNATAPGSVTVVKTGARGGRLSMVQEFSLAPLGITPNAVGMAVM